MAEKRTLVREPGTARPRAGRLERAAGAREGEEEPARLGELRGNGEASERRGRRGERGRPSLSSEFADVNRGVLFVGIESAAIAMDVASRVLRGAVDRAFDEDYTSPGDLMRGLAGEGDHAIFDLVAELRNVPRRLSHRFEEAVRSPRADQGVRQRHAEQGATTPADSPANKTEKRG